MSVDIDQIKRLIKQVLHQIIGDQEFLSDHLQQWHKEVLQEIIDQLKEIEEKKMKRTTMMKYVVTVLIGEKKESMQMGLHTALACLWDGTSDGCITVKWENRSVFSIATVFALSI